MSKFPLEWIDKNAEVGPLFRIGTKDVYSRDLAGGRVIRLAARHSPNLDYLEPAVRAFAEISAHWNAPVIFIIDPDVRKPPATQFLFEWSQAAHQNGSVDQSFMVMHNPVTQLLGRFVCRMFCQAGMSFEAILGEKNLAARLQQFDTQVNWADWSPREAPTTALAVRRKLGEGAYGQLLRRLFKRRTTA